MVVVNFDKKDLENIVGKELSDDTLKNKVPMIGCECEEVTENEVEYELFPDRPDMISVEGFGRALRYFLDLDKGLNDYKTSNGQIRIKTDRKVKDVRPNITGAVIRNVDLNEHKLRSLMQFQEKIHETFGRKRKKVSIGLHDLENIEPPFTYQAVDPESVSFIPLERDKKMSLKEISEEHPKGKYAEIISKNNKWPIIVDSNDQILSFPPVINSKLTEIDEDTKDIFIDITGTDQEAIDQTLNMLVTGFAERDFDIETIEIDGIEKPNLKPETIKVNIEYANKLLDLDLKENEFKKIIEGMGFGYEDGVVKIPPYRVDVMHEIDIVEDVAIKYGYEEFNPRIPDVSTIGQPDKAERFKNKIRELFVGFGFQEIVTSVLTNTEKQFNKMEEEKEEIVTTKNPLTREYSSCRIKLMPGMLKTLKENKHVAYPQKIFEVSSVVHVDRKQETKSRNVDKLAAAISDNNINYTDLAAKIDAMFDLLGLDYELKPIKSKKFIDTRAAKIVVNNTKIGEIGEIHPQVLENWNLEKPAVAMEINLEKLKR